MMYLGGRGRRISEFEASPVYKVSSRTARATWRNPVSEKKRKEEKRREEKRREEKRREKEKKKERKKIQQMSLMNIDADQFGSLSENLV